MKKYTITILLFFAAFLFVHAQNREIPSRNRMEHNADSVRLDSALLHNKGNIIDTVSLQMPNIYAWKISRRLGERTFVPRDTLTTNFHQSMSVDGKSVAMGYLGNIGSPAQSKIFFERPETSRFIFLDPMYLWRKNPEDHYFLNTKVPYSNVKYQSGGGGETAENRLQTELTMNFGKKLNVGFDFDYVYSRGSYKSLSNKQVSYDFYASYIGDKYKMHAFLYNNNFTNIENGGIEDLLYITNPDAANGGNGFKGSSLDIPVRMENTRNKMRGRHIYVTNRYDLGDNMEEYQINDTLTGVRKKANYVPLASAIFTTHYSDQRRSITSTNKELDKIYFPYYENGELVNNPKYGDDIDDYMSYYSFKNTLALAMNEGFRSWTKFGLSAFVEYDMRKYLKPLFMSGLEGGASSNMPTPNIKLGEKYSENSLLIGGVLSKEKGKYLKYRASVEKDLLRNDFKADGEIETMLNFKGKKLSVKANAYIKNITPSFFQNHFASKYWNWDYDFGDTRRVFVGGEINFPELSFSKTRISGGVENIQNYIYWGADGLPKQASGSAQVVSLRLDQNLKAGILHWDNQIVYQKTTNDEAIPLPDLSIYSNLYIMTKIAKVLTLQLGVDAHFHTEYYLPGYEPLTMQFYNQRERKIGNFPITTAYLNLHLKYTRFFVMMYNVAEGMGNGQSFSMYRYPVNPMGLKLGLSWQFNN